MNLKIEHKDCGGEVKLFQWHDYGQVEDGGRIYGVKAKCQNCGEEELAIILNDYEPLRF